jgi:hypothetical protein
MKDLAKFYQIFRLGSCTTPGSTGTPNNKSVCFRSCFRVPVPVLVREKIETLVLERIIPVSVSVSFSILVWSRLRKYLDLIPTGNGQMVLYCFG